MKAKYILVPAMVLALAMCSAFTVMHEDIHAAMQKSMQKMKSMKMTGDADHDFAMMMAEHHQGSIDAAQIVLKSGKDEKIKSMARSLVDKQTAEQKQLRSHKGTSEDHSAHARNENAASNSGSGTSDAHASNFSSEMTQSMEEMESSMKNMKMTNNVDHDFAMMMIPHHQSAIDMSDAIIKHGKDQEVKTLAEKIKSDSEKEIGELKKWLSSHGK